MSSKKRIPSWKSSSKKDKEVERTPSKLYRKIVADEVADFDNSSFADLTRGDVSPVKLISVKHRGYINPHILDSFPGSVVDPGQESGVTYQFQSQGVALATSGHCVSISNSSQPDLYADPAGAGRDQNTAEIMTAPSAQGRNDNYAVNGIREKSGDNSDLQTSLFFEEYHNNRRSTEEFSSVDSSMSFEDVTGELCCINFTKTCINLYQAICYTCY